MAVYSQEQIVGALIPDVYIKKITLESSPSLKKRVNSRIDPHTSGKSPDGSSLEFGKGYSNIENKDNPLTVTLNMCIKDKLESNMFTTWFTKQDMHKYLTVLVVQSTDPFTTKMLAASNNAVQIANFEILDEEKYGAWEQPGGMPTKLFSMMSDVKGTPDFKEYDSILDDNPKEIWNHMKAHMNKKRISFSDVVENLKIQDLMDKQFGAENTREFDVPFNVQFEIDGDPQHLSYFAVSLVDLTAIREKFGINIQDPFFIDLMTGNTIAELVLSGGTVVSTSYVYRTADNVVYSGPVQKFNDGYYPVNITEEARKAMSPLKRDTFPSGKVQDFRALERFQDGKYRFFSSAQSNLLHSIGKYKKVIAEDTALKINPSAWFTDIALTTDSKHNIKVAFGINYRKLIKDNAKYAGLYDSGSKELFEAVKIRNMNFLRRRVTNEYQGLNQLGSPANLRDIFNEKEQVPVIVATGRDVLGKLESDSVAAGHIKESIAETLLDEYDEFTIRHFEAVDYSMKNITDGFYQYGIEVEIEDNTHKLLSEAISLLAKAKVDFDKYAIAASVPTVGSNKNESSITTKSGYGLSASQTLETRTLGAFDSLRNRFTDKFIKEQEALYPEEMESPWGKAIWRYFIFLSQLSGAHDLDIGIGTMQQVSAMVSPRTGTPQGINFFQKLLDDLVSKSLDFLNTKMAVNSNKNGTTKAVMPLAPKHRSIKVDYWFPNSWDSNLPKAGYNFLEEEEPGETLTEPGLKHLTFNDFEEIVDKETLKHFKSLNELLEIAKDGQSYNTGDSLELSKFKYLTPTSVDLAGSTTNFSVDPHNSEKNMMVKAAIQSLNNSKQSPFLPLTPLFKPFKPLRTDYIKQAKKVYSNTMSNFNVIVKALPQNLIKPTFREADRWVDVTENLGDDYDYVDPIDGSVTDKPAANTEKVENDAAIILETLSTEIDLNNTGLKGKQTYFNEKKLAKKKQMFYDGNYYNLNFDKNAFAKERSVPGGNPKKEKNAALTVDLHRKFLAMPNPIKALFIGSIKPSVVKYDPFKNKGIYFEHPINHGTIIFNYKMIRKVEVLIGYKLDDKGVPLVKHPIWKEIDETIMSRLAGKSMLCRHIKYQDKKVGIITPSSMKLPVYDRYFTISVPPKEEPPTPARTQRARAGVETERKIKKAINSVLIQNKSIPSEYLHTVDVGMKNVKPTMHDRAMVNFHGWDK